MTRFRDNDDDLLLQRPTRHQTPSSPTYDDVMSSLDQPTPGVYTRHQGPRTTGYRNNMVEDSGLMPASMDYRGIAPFDEQPEEAYAGNRAIPQDTLKRRSKPKNNGGRPVQSHSHASRHRPNDLDVLWNGTWSLFKEERPPLVVFSLGLLLGALLSSTVFFLISSRPASLTATTLTNNQPLLLTPTRTNTPLAGNNNTSSISLTQPAEQQAVADPKTIMPTSSSLPTAQTRQLSLSKDGAIQASAMVDRQSSSSPPLETTATPAVTPTTVATTPANAGFSLFGWQWPWASGNKTAPSTPVNTDTVAVATVNTSQGQVANPSTGDLYEVQAGDTLGGIAGRLLGDSSPEAVERIQKANNMTDPHKLSLGQKLIIPAKFVPASTTVTPPAQ
jgi:LysM repeat protein